MERPLRAVGGVPLVRRIRLAMRRVNRAGVCLEPRAGLRRDVGALLDRLDNLRQSFPEASDLLERVRLSPHVLGLLEEASGRPVRAGEGSVR